MIFTNTFEFSCFSGLFKCIFETRVKFCFLYKTASRKTVNSMEQKNRIFCQIDVQEFHLWKWHWNVSLSTLPKFELNQHSIFFVDAEKVSISKTASAQKICLTKNYWTSTHNPSKCRVGFLLRVLHDIYLV
jgi:hypothetical protein